ncbi:hypothetical protein [Streptomyces sp. FL07-04A]|uniref:hypothetical protein n=1 Tax=Streptomyces sp. FL07-04A TaxID=3028658 RepID=UPI0029AA5888|nr:hypothetical protein [Streptomyces sp. FL07-04A]MDX3575988.1 hypothetical protein [Streptomyces sp. FL07-04A]
MTVQANADTTAANARIATLTRDRRVDVRFNVNRSAISLLSSIGGGSGGGGGIGILSSSVARLAALAVGALPTLASLGQSMAAMGPAALVAVPAVLSLAAAFTAIKVGMSGVGDAFKAAFAPADKSAAAAAKSTHTLENAQRSLAKAQQGVKDAEQRAAEARVAAARQIEDAQRSLKSTVQDVADANRRAAQQVASAERDLADAQRAARQAQLDLTGARKEAAQELEDLNNRLEDAQLDQRQKVLDLQDAEQELAAVKAKGGKAGQESFDKAQLQYDRAVQALEEQRTELARLEQQTTAANKAGVEGSKTVVTAKQDVVDAQQAAIDKTRALQDAETEQARTTQDGLLKVAMAERDVADARAAARKAAVDGARDIADAQDAVADAARNLAYSQEQGAVATNKLGDAMAKLAPNARAFVNAVVAQRAAWRGLKLDVQNTLFAGLGQRFTTMSQSILPSLRAGLSGTAGVLNTMAKGAFDTVSNLGKSGQIKKLFAGLNDGLSPLARVPGQFIKGLTQVGIAASPAFKRINTAAGGFFDRLSQQIDTASKNGHLEKIIDQALEVAKQFGHLIGDIFGTIGNIMKAAGAAGGDALGSLGAVFKELRRITAMPEVQKALTSIFQAINALAKLFAGTLGAVIQAVLPLLAALAPVVTELATKFGPVLAQLAATLGQALTPIIDALLPVIGDIGNVLMGLVQALMPLLVPIGAVIAEIVQALAPVFKSIGGALVTLVAALAKGLTPVIAALVPIVAMFGQLFAALAPMFPQLITALLPLIPPVTTLAMALLNLAMQVLTPLLPLIMTLAGLLSTVLTGALGILVPVINVVVGAITGFVNTITGAVEWIVEKFRWLYDVLVGHSIIPDLVTAIIGWFGQLWAKTKELFNAGKTWLVNLWNSIWASLTSRWNTFWGGLRTALSNAWANVRTGFANLKTSLSNTWNGMWNGITSKVTTVFSTISSKIAAFKTNMTNAFSLLKNNMGTTWDGIKSKIGAPVKWVVDHVYNNGIRKMWNSIAGKISSKITLPAVALGFNTGGEVPGTGKGDIVPAMLEPGERVLSNQQVDHLGGHRAIDAMLGQDRPTKTGGNPSPQQEKQRYQGPTQHFASGGIIGKVTGAVSGAVSSAASWAKDLVIGGLKSAAQKALNALVRPLINQIPGSGIGGLMRGLANKAVDGMMGWFGNEDKKAVGGPAVQKALSWVKTQNGLPYQWAGNGNPSWDCSGLMSAIESVIRGERPHRRWATGSFVGNSGPSGWVRNLNSPFMIGITNAGVGHTAGTLAGMNVESSGGRGVHMGKSARGYNDPMFTSRWGFAPAAKYDSGGLLQPGATMAVNATRRPERILDPQQTTLFEQLVNGGGAAGGVTIENITISGSFDFSTPAARRAAANALVDEMKEAIRKSDRSRA